MNNTGLVIQYAYLDTVDQAGIIIEFMQWHSGPIPLPVNRLVYNVCVLGGVPRPCLKDG